MPNEITKPAPPADPLSQITTWILEGQSQSDIETAIKATWPTEKARPLIVAAMKNISGAAEPDYTLMRGFLVEATRLIHRRALEAGDFSAALKALRDLKVLIEG
jgi:hypothetical protein